MLKHRQRQVGRFASKSRHKKNQLFELTALLHRISRRSVQALHRLRIGRLRSGHRRASEGSENRSRPTVLHITEALGGGVMVAVDDYIRNTAHDLDHVVLGSLRAGNDTGNLKDATLLEMRQPTRRIDLGAGEIRKAYRSLRPGVVHLHSSWAGAIGRLALPWGAQIVYTPHCYGFERNDLSKVTRYALWYAEKILAYREAIVAAVSPREATLARELRPEAQAVYVPNVPPAVLSPTREQHLPSTASVNDSFVVTAVGRIVPQKGPEWFAEFAIEMRKLRHDVVIEWLGGGAATASQELAASGVTVSGWITRAEVIDRLSRSSCYVHAAAWEGAPITILEAVSIGLPVVARRIPALESLGYPYLQESPESAAQFINEAIVQGELTMVADAWRLATRELTSAAQRTRLLDVYI